VIYINLNGGTSEGVAAAGSGGNLTIGGFCSAFQITSNGGAAAGSGSGGTAGFLTFYGPVNMNSSGFIRANGGNSSTGTAGSTASLRLYGGGTINEVQMLDGSGTAPGSTADLWLCGYLQIKTLNVTNRAGITMRAYQYFPSVLRVNTLSGKDVFVSHSNTNATASQAASCAERLYIYDTVGFRWKYSTFSNA
jgi:hypothetical protein